MGKNKAPATRNPHIACEKQVKMCVSHAMKQAIPKAPAQKSESISNPQCELIWVFVCLDLYAFTKCVDQVILRCHTHGEQVVCHMGQSLLTN